VVSLVLVLVLVQAKMHERRVPDALAGAGKP
jgi:hypothetical protein